ncbi:MAG: hypothetical protein EZS28_025979, partial [Streblomastix strix]
GEDDTLLFAKADKTQLIESYSKSETYARVEFYTKGETNNLLNHKADAGVSYTKGEDDALLLLKANQSTTYIKTETDYIISLIDVGDVYLTDYYNITKTDELLSEKADKTQLIDSYTKGETDNLLNNKANNGVSYTKGEDDALLLLKVDKTQLIDSFSKSETYARDEVYTKGEADNLLNNKPNNGVSYTKGEDDTLLFAKADKTQLIDQACFLAFGFNYIVLIGQQTQIYGQIDQGIDYGQVF